LPVGQIVRRVLDDASARCRARHELEAGAVGRAELSIVNTTFAPSRLATAVEGMISLGGSLIASASSSPARKLTRAAMSGSTPALSSTNATFTMTVAFARLTRGTISLTLPR